MPSVLYCLGRKPATSTSRAAGTSHLRQRIKCSTNSLNITTVLPSPTTLSSYIETSTQRLIPRPTSPNRKTSLFAIMVSFNAIIALISASAVATTSYAAPMRAVTDALNVRAEPVSEMAVGRDGLDLMEKKWIENREIINPKITFVSARYRSG